MRNNNALIAEYFYDHAGLRYKKVDYVSGRITIYVYGQGTEPMYDEIYNANTGALINKTSYLNMGSKRIARDSGTGITYYFTDHLGSTRVIMDPSGNCTYNDYAPFGGDMAKSGTERYKFTGKEDDGVTGLQYFNARYYDPGIGHFISEDGLKDGFNWYLYCKNNPLQYVDPSGYYSTETIMGNRKIVTSVTTYRAADRELTGVGIRKLHNEGYSSDRRKVIIDFAVLGGLQVANKVVPEVAKEVAGKLAGPVGILSSIKLFFDALKALDNEHIWKQIDTPDQRFTIDKTVELEKIYQNIGTDSAEHWVLISQYAFRSYFVTYEDGGEMVTEQISESLYRSLLEKSKGESYVAIE